jgi:hypothetical protein
MRPRIRLDRRCRREIAFAHPGSQRFSQRHIAPGDGA